ncbi:2OG-Fe(II) oxygenase family protein [Qipengyuania aquimaris]|uniref:2OG-Fe(II) oxygenase family protein n=1 Tax=Qipengyuania aquimaris TaxID=255984 RepID=UPI001C947CBF|nr:2OG-Fe(II) oxygenase family protein [Qipengyuania aquimaris]MBY6129068.1 2OG-Fe(II) oxygenase family protein [Qipengyuania aquimaris]
MATTRHLFSTPFVADMLQSAEGLSLLREAIETEKARDAAGVDISNIGGWHSNTQMLEWGGEPARALAHKAMTLADEQTIDNKSPQDSRFTWHPEMWANVSGKGAANQYHFHPGSFWSAVAYIDDGYEGDTDPDLGGELQLQDPRMPMIRMGAPDLRLKLPDGQPMHSEVSLRPKTGMIVMFPSWLQHAVRPFKGEGTRISIAINLVAVLKSPA